MNVTLAFFGRELRAHWATVLVSALVTFVPLAALLHFVDVPALRFGNWSSGFFAAVSMLVMAAVVVPATVRGEFTGKDDQFLRRLPGALPPAFAGKLLFLVLAMLLLAMLALLCGQAFTALQLGASRSPWALPDAKWLHEPTLQVALLAACTVPWVFAVAWWLPAARFAVGATAVLGVAVVMAVDGVLRHCPQLDRALNLWPWLAWFTPLGVAVGAVSLVCGRRGGDHRRSAQLGAVTLIAGLLPLALHVATNAWRYHHPDPTNLSWLEVEAIDRDNRFAIVRGSSIEDVQAGGLFRVDLATGASTPIGTGGVGTSAFDMVGNLFHFGYGYLDLATGERIASTAGRDAASRAFEHAEIALRHNGRCHLRDLGDVEVYAVGNQLEFCGKDGSVERVSLPRWTGHRFLCGDGIRFFAQDPDRTFDLTLRRFVALPPKMDSKIVGAAAGVWVFKETDWHRFDARSGTVLTCAIPRQASWLCWLGDGKALAWTSRLDQPSSRVGIYDAPTDRWAELELPGPSPTIGMLAVLNDLARHPTRSGADPVWCAIRFAPATGAHVRIDPTTHRIENVTLPGFRVERVLDDSWLLGVADDRTIERRNWRTGERVQVFPPQR